MAGEVLNTDGLDRLNRAILLLIERAIDARLAPFTNAQGKIDLGKGTGLAGRLGQGRGGTGNGAGRATPKDGSVTDASVAEDAGIAPAKLAQDQLAALVYTIVKGALLAGSHITITANDAAHTLTIASTAGGGGGSVATLSDVALNNLIAGQILRFDGTKWRNVDLDATLNPDNLTIFGQSLTVGGTTLTYGGS